MLATEAPRGEVTYYVVSNGGQTNGRVNIHVPTYKNAATVPSCLKEILLQMLVLLLLVWILVFHV